MHHKGQCTIKDCVKIIGYVTVGLCNAHYLRLYRHGRLTLKYPTLTEDEKNIIISRYESGESSYSIAKDFNCQSDKIRFWLKRWNIPLRKVGFQKGQGSPRYKGQTISNGYIYSHSPNHPYATQKGYIAEHRLIMESHIGRYLEPHEQCHHINGNKQDNRIENLQLLSIQDHTRLHNKSRTRITKHGVCIECKTFSIKIIKSMCQQCYGRIYMRTYSNNNPEYRAKRKEYMIKYRQK